MRKQDDMSSVRKKLEDYSYIMNNQIGKGYSSQVYKGKHDVTDETVAIKVIDMKMIKGEVHKNLLASEIQVLKMLKNSDNIIDVYDIYNTKNNTYIITQLCGGGDLSKTISSKRSLSEGEAVGYMNQIINGYCNIYNKGVIHRDLKPANIFLKDGEIKIADFGFAMKTSDCRKYSSYNVGSPVYMPPEALNENKYSFKSDVWALGIIFYEMLTGKTPWRAKTQKQLARLLTTVPIKKLMPPSISSSSQNFLLKTLTTNINERMCPEDLSRFTLSEKNTSSSIRSKNPLYSTTDNSVFDGRNNTIRRNQNKGSSYIERDTSLNKNAISTPKKVNKLNCLQNQQPVQEFKSTQNFSLPKPSNATKTEHYIGSTAHTINNVEALTQKQINIHHSVKDTNLPVNYDKKFMSKQLLSQIHFCRFLFKLIMRMKDKLNSDLNSEMSDVKNAMVGMIFGKLDEVESLQCISNNKISADYRNTSDFNKISQIIEQYKAKYNKDLSFVPNPSSSFAPSLHNFKQVLTDSILILYTNLEDCLQTQSVGPLKQQIIVLDYLVTLRQLVGLQQNYDIEGFHNKSKIETIVEGAPAKTIGEEHLNAIRNKLKAIKII